MGNSDYSCNNMKSLAKTEDNNIAKQKKTTYGRFQKRKLVEKKIGGKKWKKQKL